MTYFAANSLKPIKWLVISCLVLIPLFQVMTLWSYTGDKVDESELVHFAVGFLGGDLDPVWEGYGHLGMYLLGAVYFLLGLVPLAIGVFDSWAAYGSQLLTGGYFFLVARYVFALSAVLAAAIAARMLVRQDVAVWLAVLFFVFTVISPVTIKYANYVRTDTLVLLFAVTSLYAVTCLKGKWKIFSLATSVAAAIACKISAAPLGLLLVIALISHFRNHDRDWKTLMLSGLWFVFCLKLFQPYVNYTELIKRVVHTSYLEKEASVARIPYESLLQRVEQITQFHMDAVGAGILALALLSLGGFWTRYRSLVAYTWLTAGLLNLPYLMSSTLRDYWFIPSYFLVMLLATIAVASAMLIMNRAIPSRLSWMPRAVVLALALAFPGLSSAVSYLDKVQELQMQSASNSKIARLWLEDNHLGRTPIRIDRHFSWLYPKLYDPGNLIESRKISRLFIYERENNRFLADVFESYLYSSYRKEHFPAGRPYFGLLSIEIQHGPSGRLIGDPEFCSKFSESCFPAALIPEPGIHELGETSDSAPSVLKYLPQFPVAADGSFSLRLKCDGEGVWLKLAYAGDSEHALESLWFDCMGGGMAIDRKADIVWVKYFGTREREMIDSPDKGEVIFVTSPAAYKRLRMVARGSAGTPRGKKAEAFVRHYKPLLSDKIREFRKGAGVDIEIFQL